MVPNANPSRSTRKSPKSASIAFNSQRARFSPIPAQRKAKKRTAPLHAGPPARGTASARALHTERGTRRPPHPALRGQRRSLPTEVTRGHGAASTARRGPPALLGVVNPAVLGGALLPARRQLLLAIRVLQPRVLQRCHRDGRSAQTRTAAARRTAAAPAPPLPAVSANGAAAWPQSTMGNAVRAGGSAPQVCHWAAFSYGTELTSLRTAPKKNPNLGIRGLKRS